MSNLLKQLYEEELKSTELLARLDYPHLEIVPDSIAYEPNHPIFGNRKRVTVVCGCGAHVERATSDLHNFYGCQRCLRASRRLNKLMRRALIDRAIPVDVPVEV